MRALVTVRCYEELNDFLPPERRRRPFPLALQRGQTVKNLVESLGIPHTEVDLVLVGGRSVGFRHRLADGDRVSVYPVFESLDITAVSRVRPRPLRQPRFVLDVHLGRLARLLRLAGFDSLYSNGWDDGELSRISRREARILLTRDRGLLMRAEVTHGYCVRSACPPEQLREVLARFDLNSRLEPFSLCLVCNRKLERLSRRRAKARVPEKVARSYRRFRVCPRCGRVYWRGTHWESMRRLLAGALSP
jgi:uncharacterized protein with PIN domain/sulfur carrier protein ThiS